MRETLAAWGEDIRVRREAAGLSQRQFAAAVGTTQQHLSLIERGAVSPGDDLRVRLAAALGCSVAELFPYPEAV